MEFPGLSDDDLGNVRALNRRFLDRQRRMHRCEEPCEPTPDRLPELIAALNERQLDRLESTPFLLFSLRERDRDYWDSLLDGDPNRDLFATQRSRDDNGNLLLTASLGFLWHLARRNAYAARVVSGASLSWCERLADETFVSLLARAAQRADIPAPRFHDDAGVWKKLLSAGVSAEASVRRAAHLTAMQTMLTRSAPPTPGRLRAAACRMPAPRTR